MLCSLLRRQYKANQPENMSEDISFLLVDEGRVAKAQGHNAHPLKRLLSQRTTWAARPILALHPFATAIHSSPSFKHYDFSFLTCPSQSLSKSLTFFDTASPPHHALPPAGWSSLRESWGKELALSPKTGVRSGEGKEATLASIPG